MPRLFVAVWPPEDVIAELTALARKDRRGIRFVEPERWHLTLRFLGDAAVDDAAEALDRAELPAATVRLGPAVDVLDERALVIPASGLDHLAAAVNSATADVGEAPRRRFRGHLTVARVKASASMPPLLGALVEASFEASEVALVESTLHPDGARYDTIATWPLGVSPWWTDREDEAPARPPSAAATGSVGSRGSVGSPASAGSPSGRAAGALEPTGVAAASVPPGRILELPGFDAVAWRSAAGDLCVVDARCPHQWSPFAFDGVVAGDELVCSAHGWCFDREGRGSKLAMNGRRDPKSNVEVLACREIEGEIWVERRGSPR